MIYSKELEEMCTVAKGVNHGPAPIPEEGKWVKAKEIKDLYMYKRIKIPGLLLEVGFISNPNERYILRQNWYQEKIAKVISNCLVEILV